MRLDKHVKPSPRGNQKGVAMMMAIMAMAILSIIAGDMMYQYAVYSRVVYNNLNQLQAEQLAKAALRIAKLQVHGAQQLGNAIEKLGLPVSPEIADQIWQTPFILPPPVPPGANLITKQAIEKLKDELNLPGTISISISGESQKLNLNSLVWKNPEPEKKKKEEEDKKKKKKDPNEDLDGDGIPDAQQNPEEPQNPEEENQNKEKEDPIKVQRQILTDTIDQMIANELERNEAFRESARNLTGEEVVKNILGWIDPKAETLGNGQNRDEFYATMEPKISPKLAPLFSLSELRFVKDFDEHLMRLFENNFTTLITHGININKINAQVLRSIVPSMTEEEAEEIIKRRDDPDEGAKFKTVDEFFQLLSLTGDYGNIKTEMEQRGIVLVTKESVYRVMIRAEANDAVQNWIAHLGPTAPVIEEKKQAEEKQNKDPVSGGDKVDNNEDIKESQEKDNKKQEKQPVEPPEVVYLKVV